MTTLMILVKMTPFLSMNEIDAQGQDRNPDQEGNHLKNLITEGAIDCKTQTDFLMTHSILSNFTVQNHLLKALAIRTRGKYMLLYTLIAAYKA